MKKILEALEYKENPFGIQLQSQLSNKEYAEIKPVIEKLGGYWNKKLGYHLFAKDPKPLIRNYLETGQLPPKNPHHYFPTPEETIKTAVLFDYARKAIQRNKNWILEPSAGDGTMAETIAQECDFPKSRVICIEIDPNRAQICRNKGFPTIKADFLTWDNPENLKFDVVIMNPPFQTNNWMKHIQHATSLAQKGALLISIIPKPKTDKQTGEFLFQFEQAEISTLPKNTFKDTGTNIDTAVWVAKNELKDINTKIENITLCLMNTHKYYDVIMKEFRTQSNITTKNLQTIIEPLLIEEFITTHIYHPIHENEYELLKQKILSYMSITHNL